MLLTALSLGYVRVEHLFFEHKFVYKHSTIHVIRILASLAAAGMAGVAASQPDAAIRRELEALNAAMVAAFKREPGSVAAFYTDEALIVGGGQRTEGRAAVVAYWKGGTIYSDWTLETLQTGGSAEAPWQYGRSVVVFVIGKPRRAGGTWPHPLWREAQPGRVTQKSPR